MILLDMALPMMDGFAVVRYLKDNKYLSQIPVIAMTARVMKGDREKILAAGCDQRAVPSSGRTAASCDGSPPA
jgi:CheY-like chemotaxis protein